MTVHHDVQHLKRTVTDLEQQVENLQRCVAYNNAMMADIRNLVAPLDPEVVAIDRARSRAMGHSPAVRQGSAGGLALDG